MGRREERQQAQVAKAQAKAILGCVSSVEGA